MDAINKQILEMLLYEARTPLNKIAKKCKLSTPNVHSRIKKMKKKGIINGSIMQINPQKLGFSCVGLMRISTNPGKENEVRSFLRKKKLSIYDYNYFGKLNIGAFYALPDINGLANLINQIKANPKVKEVQSIIWYDLIKFDHPENLILSKSEKNPKKIENPQETFSDSNTKTVLLDKKDIEILKILTKNAQIPFSNIAKKIGIAPNTVIKRYKRLRKEGIISFSSITVNLEKLNYKAITVVFIKISSDNNSTKIYNQLIHKPNIIVTIRLLGFYDLMILIPIRSISDIFALKHEYHKIKEIEKFELEIHASYTKWPLNIFSSLLDKIKPSKK